MKAHLVAEHPTHFEMHDGKAPFRVHKVGLSEATAAKIRALAPQKLYGGGEAEERPDVALKRAEEILAAREEAKLQPPADAIPVTLNDMRGDASAGLIQDPFPSKAATADVREAPLAYPAAPLDVVPPGVAQQNQGTAPPIKPPSSPRNAAMAAAPVRPVVAARAPGEDFTAEERAAVAQRGEIEAQAAREKASQLGEYQRQLEAEAVQANERRARAAQAADAHMAEIRRARDEMKNIDVSVDPGRFWATRSTPQKIAGAIGLALGAFGAGNDGVNRAAGIIENAVNRDLDAQKTEHEFRMKKGQAAIEAATSMYGLHRQQVQDDLAADAAAKGTALALVQNKLAQIEASTASPAAKANAQQLSAQLGQKQKELDDVGKQRAFDNSIKLQQLQIERDRIAAEAANKAAGTDKTKQALIEGVETENRTIQESGAALKKLIDKYGTSGGLTGPGAAQMKQLTDNIATAAAKLKDPTSVARASEVEAELKNLFKPGFFQSADTAKAQIDAYLGNAQQRHNDALRVRGVTLAEGGDQNAQALAWARANPSDPRAEKILRKLGVR